MNLKRICVLLSTFLFSVGTFASHLQVDEAEVVMEDFKSKIIQTVNSKQPSELANYFATDGIMILGNSKLLRTREQIRSFMGSPYLNEEVKINRFMIDEVTIDKPIIVLDNNTFIATGKAKYQIIFNKSKKIGLPNRWIMVLSKEQNEWHIASYQGTVNAFDNPYIEDMRYVFYLISLVTFLLGIIVAVAWRRIKKSNQL